MKKFLLLCAIVGLVSSCEPIAENKNANFDENLLNKELYDFVHKCKYE